MHLIASVHLTHDEEMIIALYVEYIEEEGAGLSLSIMKLIT